MSEVIEGPDRDIFTLPSGATLYANRRKIGINPLLELSEGYDSELTEYDQQNWTQQDKIALADYMISLWTKYRDSIRGGG
jgi:hypothetical protein